MCVSSCIAALLGAEVTLTDLPDRLRLLKKNIETNLDGDFRGSAAVNELIWGEEPDMELIEPLPDYGTKILYLMYILRNSTTSNQSCISI